MPDETTPPAWTTPGACDKCGALAGGDGRVLSCELPAGHVGVHRDGNTVWVDTCPAGAFAGWQFDPVHGWQHLSPPLKPWPMELLGPSYKDA